MIITIVSCLGILLGTYLVSSVIQRLLIIISKKQIIKLNKKFKDLSKMYLLYDKRYLKEQFLFNKK